MSKALLICIFCSVLACSWSQHHQNYHNCLNCFHISDPSTCNDVVPCSHGKDCFVTKYTGPDKQTYYHLGCESHGVCIHSEHYIHGHHSWHYPYHHNETQCGHCCRENECNRLTC